MTRKNNIDVVGWVPCLYGLVYVCVRMLTHQARPLRPFLCPSFQAGAYRMHRTKSGRNTQGPVIADCLSYQSSGEWSHDLGKACELSLRFEFDVKAQFWWEQPWHSAHYTLLVWAVRSSLILLCYPQIVLLLKLLDDVVDGFAAIESLTAAKLGGHLGSLVHDQAFSLWCRDLAVKVSLCLIHSWKSEDFLLNLFDPLGSLTNFDYTV